MPTNARPGKIGMKGVGVVGVHVLGVQVEHRLNVVT